MCNNRLAWLAIISFLIFGICDCLSTIYVYTVVQTFEYEQSWSMRLAFDIAGIWGFIAFKLFIVGLMVYLIYYLGKTYRNFTPLSEWIYAGVIIAGAYVSITNVWSAITLDTPQPFGLNPGLIATAILLSGFAIGTYKVYIQPPAVA